MLVEGQVGKPELANGAKHPLRLGKNGAIISNPGYPSYAQSVLDGESYCGSNLLGTPVTTQAGLSATTPALTLYNPVGSGIYLVMTRVNITITSSPAAAVGFSLAYNSTSAAAPSATTDATVTNSIVGTTKSPAGQCYRISTLAAAPVAFRYLGGTSGASAIEGIVITDVIDGQVVLSPGTAVSIQSTTAAAILADFTWLEIPIV